MIGEGALSEPVSGNNNVIEVCCRDSQSSYTLAEKLVQSSSLVKC